MIYGEVGARGQANPIAVRPDILFGRTLSESTARSRTGIASDPAHVVRGSSAVVNVEVDERGHSGVSAAKDFARSVFYITALPPFWGGVSVRVFAPTYSTWNLKKWSIAPSGDGRLWGVEDLADDLILRGRAAGAVARLFLALDVSTFPFPYLVIPLFYKSGDRRFKRVDPVDPQKGSVLRTPIVALTDPSKVDAIRTELPRGSSIVVGRVTIYRNNLGVYRVKHWFFSSAYDWTDFKQDRENLRDLAEQVYKR